MNNPNILKGAFAKFFGKRWDKMTDEERRVLASDPTFLGRMEADRDVEMRRKQMQQKAAFNEAQRRARGGLIGGVSATY
jgi:hypothetical protein